MISEDNIEMLNILADSLHNKKKHTIEKSKWNELLNELKLQTVYAVPSDTLDLSNTDKEEQFNYLKRVASNMQFFYKLMNEQQKVLNILDNAKIPVAVLKGAAAAINYPTPHLRCMGDIDIIVKPEDFSRAYEILKEAGLKTNETPENYNRHIAFSNSNGIETELHNHFSSGGNAKYGEILDKMISEALSYCEKKKIYKYEISVLPSNINGFVLLEHINHHLSSGLGLRQIIDWMCFVEKNLDDFTWNNSFSEEADKIGLKKLALISTAMCKKYLNLNKNITWCDEKINDSTCDELMEYILNHGNFGVKNKKECSSVSAIRHIKNPFKGLIEIQKIGCNTWKALKKHKWLKPFAWIYQIFRWIKHARQNNISLSDTIDLSKTESKVTNMMTRLGITKF